MTALLFLPPLLGLALLLWALARLEKQGTHPHGKIRQRHHGFYGVVLALGGAAMIVFGSGPTAVLGGLAFAFGIWWLIDDARQHLIQYRRPSYLSPWHRWAHSVGLI